VTPGPPLPAYGSATIAELMPSALAVVAGEGPDPLHLGETLGGVRRVCVVLVDGLGRDLLEAHGDVAPTLTALRSAGGSRVLDTCFPSTTVTSLTSLGTGLPAGRHGMVGYTAWLREVGFVVNLIQFTRYGATKTGSLLGRLTPEHLQPNSTVFERASRAGIPAVTVSDARWIGSGLTRAALRGPAYLGWKSEDEIPGLALDALESHDRVLVFAYDPRLDHTAHGHGVASEQARAVLAAVDEGIGRLVSGLTPGCAVIVTGDHGMVDVTDGRIDIDDSAALSAGVRAIGGEPRIRHLYTQEGAADEVAAAWREQLGGQAWVATRAQALDAAWFGPQTQPEARSRIGDVVVAYSAEGGVFCQRIDPRQATLRGHHGSFTEAEAKVPMLVAKP